VSLDVVKYLCENGSNIQIPDKSIIMAIDNRRFDIIWYLCKKGFCAI